MLLELTVVSYHRLSQRQEAVKTFSQFGGTIGRSESSDWYLPDPERVVSGTHARIEKRGDSFYISDLSTNGLFVNRSVEPLGDQRAHELKDGDFLSLGEYEIEVRLVAETSHDEPRVENKHVSSESNSPAISLMGDVSQPHADTVLGNQAALPDVSPKSASSLGGGAMGIGIPMADFTSSPGSERKEGVTVDSVQSVDATSVSDTLDDHFIPPAPQIPEEWDAQFSGIAPTATTTVVPEPVSPPATPSESTVSPVSNDQLTAFLKGLGITSDMVPANAGDQWWEQLGTSFQELLLGLMDVLRNRSTTKSEFRVNQTTFQQKENNPLKFSATLEEAFHNLYNRPGSSFLPARQAIKDAYADINRHEEAIMAGAKGAVNGVLKQLAPELIQSKDFTTSFMDKMSPSKRQARYWDIYRELYQDIHGEFSKEGDRAMNDEFTAAYEAALKK